MKKFIAWIVGKVVSKNLRLEDGPMTDKKPWYKSKGVITGIVTVLVGTYETVKVALAPQVGWSLPDIPPVLYTILGALGVYARAAAKTTLTK